MLYQKKNSQELKSSTRPQISLSPKEVEEQLVQNFPNLGIEGGLHQLFSSYDFRPDEKLMVDEWEKILDYLYTNIFNTLASSFYDIKRYTIISHKIPICLNNILQQLRIEQKYIYDKDLNDDKFYQINFPNLYNSNSGGIISSIFTGVSNIFSFAGNKFGCIEEKDTGRNGPIRTDITESEKYETIDDKTLIFNYEIFRNHCNQLLMFIKDYLNEKDVDIISTKNLKQILNDDKQQNLGGFELKYGTQYLDFALTFLSKIKKIVLFDIELNNKMIQCIKVLKNENDNVSEKDNAVAKLLLQIESLEKQISDLQLKTDKCMLMAKNKLKSGDKISAKRCLAQKNVCEKHLNNLRNGLNILEDQVFALKNAENNANVAEVLKNCVSLHKEKSLKPEDMEDLISDMKEQKENMEDINNEIKDYAKENVNDEEIDKEIEDLLKEDNDKDMEFPMPNKETLSENISNEMDFA